MASTYNNKNVTPNGGMDTLTVGGFGGGLAPSTAATAMIGGQQSAAAAAAAASKRPVRRGVAKAQPERPIRALFCLGLRNPIRKLCITIVEWKYPLMKKKN